MPKLIYSQRFANDLARITSPKVEKRILENLDNIEKFGEFGSRNVPPSIKKAFGDEVRKIAVHPFDLAYTLIPEKDTAQIEALVYQRAAK